VAGWAACAAADIGANIASPSGGRISILQSIFITLTPLFFIFLDFLDAKFPT
jgi:hypothetical protein